MEVPRNYYENTPFRYRRDDHFDHRDMVSRQQFRQEGNTPRYVYDQVQPRRPELTNSHHLYDTQNFDVNRQPFRTTGTNNQPEHRAYNYGTEHPGHMMRLQHDRPMGGRRQHGPPPFASGQHFEHGRQYGVDYDRHFKRRQRQERGQKRALEDNWMRTDLDKIDTHLFDLDLGHHEDQGYQRRDFYGGRPHPST